MNTPKFISLFFALQTFMGFSAPVHAEDGERWYQVEVILFSQNNPLYEESELWPLDFTLPQLEQAQELLPPDSSQLTDAPALLPKPFSLVSNERLNLTDTAERVKLAQDVELLMHLGWLQPGLPQDKAIPIHIYSGMLDNINPELTDESETATTIDKPITEAETEMSMGFVTESPSIDGTLRLILSRYLHLETDLIWKKPLPSFYQFFEPPVAPLEVENPLNSSDSFDDSSMFGMESDLTPFNYQIFRMQQSRKMRSNEIHYIDHPLFGIIVQVTRYEPEKAEEETKL